METATESRTEAAEINEELRKIVKRFLREQCSFQGRVASYDVVLNARLFYVAFRYWAATRGDVELPVHSQSDVTHLVVFITRERVTLVSDGRTVYLRGLLCTVNACELSSALHRSRVRNVVLTG